MELKPDPTLELPNVETDIEVEDKEEPNPAVTFELDTKTDDCEEDNPSIDDPSATSPRFVLNDFTSVEGEIEDNRGIEVAEILERDVESKFILLPPITPMLLTPLSAVLPFPIAKLLTDGGSVAVGSDDDNDVVAARVIDGGGGGRISISFPLVKLEPP